MHKSKLGCLVIDCKTDDLDSEAEFWSKALGCKVFRRYQPGDENYRGLETDESQPRILLQKVTHESRIHLDIESNDIDREVDRLEKLGAKELERVRHWCVMQAPSGHKFCVVRHQDRNFEENANKWNENT
jgi:hypothetical protein